MLGWPESLDSPRDTLSQRYHRASTMVGVLPLGTGGKPRKQAAFFWSLKGSDHTRWQDGGLTAWSDEVRALWSGIEPLIDQIVDLAQLTFARFAHRTLPQPVAESLIHIGDAWHSASPQLG